MEKVLMAEDAATALFNWYAERSHLFTGLTMPNPVEPWLQSASDLAIDISVNPSMNLSHVPSQTLALLGGQIAMWLAATANQPVESILFQGAIDETEVLPFVFETHIAPMICFSQGVC